MSRSAVLFVASLSAILSACAIPAARPQRLTIVKPSDDTGALRASAPLDDPPAPKIVSVPASAAPRSRSMPIYLTRFSYTPETWARLAKQPEDRRNAARAYIESVGGKLVGFWYALGEYDGYTLWEAPDNVSMAAVSIALSGGGALSKVETTPL